MFLVASTWAFLYVDSTRQVVERNLDKATAAVLINSTIGAAGVAALFWEEFLPSFSASGKQL